MPPLIKNAGYAWEGCDKFQIADSTSVTPAIVYLVNPAGLDGFSSAQIDPLSTTNPLTNFGVLIKATFKVCSAVVLPLAIFFQRTFTQTCPEVRPQACKWFSLLSSVAPSCNKFHRKLKAAADDSWMFWIVRLAGLLICLGMLLGAIGDGLPCHVAG